MRLITLLLFLSLTGVAGCSGDLSLQATFEKQMEDDGADGFNIIHIDEKENRGLVLYTSWTEEYPDNKNHPGINYYHKLDQRWESRPGTACSDSGVSRLGLSDNGHLFCAVLKENMKFEKIRVGGSDAHIFNVSDSIRVWYGVADDKNAKAVGIISDGREVTLN